MFSWLQDSSLFSKMGSLLTLSGLEIVLSIDNLVFISILSSKLPQSKQSSARRLGLILAVITRIILLLSISFVMKVTYRFPPIFGHSFSAKDLILLLGGLFLLGKSTYEIHDKLEAPENENPTTSHTATLFGTVLQILLLDVVFSIDSVVTAVGMAKEIWIMIAAVLLSTGVMLVAANWVSQFIQRHPTVKMLALSFLILIGVMLVAEAFEKPIPRGYLYFAILFSLFVEALNIGVRKRSKPLKLRNNEIKQTEIKQTEIRQPDSSS